MLYWNLKVRFIIIAGAAFTYIVPFTYVFVALGLDGDLVCPANFPLPTLHRKLAILRLDIHRGKGFALIRGLNPSEYSSADLTTLYLGIQSYIANVPGRQDEKGNMLGLYNE